MTSPFLGMDPYIESRRIWEDFHGRLIVSILDSITEVAPDDYLARGGERYYVVLESDDAAEQEKHQSVADVGVTLPRNVTEVSSIAATSAAAVATAGEEEPQSLRGLVSTEYRESFVEVYALEPERRLVTTIEVLSPSNKRRNSEGWNRYLRKRQAHLAGEANLVEIDLLRGGDRFPMDGDWPASPYYVLTCWRASAPASTVWPGYVNKSLPKMRVPLDPPDDDVVIDLQSLIDAIYERARYGRDIDYQKPCRPPLDELTQKWLAERLEQVAANDVS